MGILCTISSVSTCSAMDPIRYISGTFGRKSCFKITAIDLLRGLYGVALNKSTLHLCKKYCKTIRVLNQSCIAVYYVTGRPNLNIVI